MKEKVLIIGSGGHARSIIDILMQNDEYEIAGCISNEYGEQEFIDGSYQLPIIGNDDMLESIYNSGIKNVIVALGGNNLREKIYNEVCKIGYNPINAISKYSYISPTARIGRGCCVMAGACIGVDTVIGDNCIVNTNASLDHDCSVGNNVHVAPGVAVSGFVTIGDNTQLGTGAAVIDRLTIGKNVFVGAGAAVINNIEDDVLVVGVPAKVIKKR